MEQDKKHDIALMRYSVISPLITGIQEDYSSLSAFFRDASVKGVTAPDGSIRKYAPGTIEKWYLAYKQGGFDALLPTGRSDAGKPRKLDDELQEQIRYLKINYRWSNLPDCQNQLLILSYLILLMNMPD